MALETRAYGKWIGANFRLSSQLTVGERRGGDLLSPDDELLACEVGWDVTAKAGDT
jgi:hypothetical protein